MNLILNDNYLEIKNITLIKEFNEERFLIEIDSIPYEIKGTELVLDDVSNGNTAVKIKGNINSISKTNISKKKEKSFIKRLLA
ncbi:MAG: YabP/YqfC family sporulation protein [Anaeroplasma sp.]|nr:YabP/YqfC family sporulation protein [Anaeroplasma sp.]